MFLNTLRTMHPVWYIDTLRMDLRRMFRHIVTALSEVFFHSHHTYEIGWRDISSEYGIFQVASLPKVVAESR